MHHLLDHDDIMQGFPIVVSQINHAGKPFSGKLFCCCLMLGSSGSLAAAYTSVWFELFQSIQKMLGISAEDLLCHAPSTHETRGTESACIASTFCTCLLVDNPRSSSIYENPAVIVELSVVVPPSLFWRGDQLSMFALQCECGQSLVHDRNRKRKQETVKSNEEPAVNG